MSDISYNGLARTLEVEARCNMRAFEYVNLEYEIQVKLQAADEEAEGTSIRFSAEEALEAMRNAINQSV